MLVLGGLDPADLVEDGFQDVTNVARANGQTVQAMGILKQPGSNAVGVAKAYVDQQRAEENGASAPEEGGSAKAEELSAAGS